MNQAELSIRTRGKNSKNQNRRARGEGQIPAVIYGGTAEPRPVYVETRPFERLLKTLHGSTIYTLRSEGEGAVEQAIVRELQRHPVSEKPIHIDFLRIELDKEIVVEVPIHGTGGVPAGVKLGGILEMPLRRVTIKALPLAVPDSLEVDISGMVIGKTLHVSDLSAPTGVEILTHGELALFHVAAPSTEEESKPGEGGAQPEVVGAKEKEAKKAEAGKGAPKAGGKEAAKPAAGKDAGKAAPKAGGKEAPKKK